MYKRFIIAAIAFVLSAITASAQKTDSSFERHNRWMVGGSIIKNFYQDIGLGATGIYGRQFSEIVFLGVGFGMETHVRKTEESGVIIENNGNRIERIFPPYRWSFNIPVYADLQINFSRKKAPFYAEIKAGYRVEYNIRRVRGTESYDKLVPSNSGLLTGVGIGKRFILKNGDEINVNLGMDCILGFGPEMPVFLGIRYGF